MPRSFAKSSDEIKRVLVFFFFFFDFTCTPLVQVHTSVGGCAQYIPLPRSASDENVGTPWYRA